MSLIAHYLRHQGVFALIEERVRFARRRFGRYELIDFVAVLLGYAISGERTLETFYERLQPFANTFMALFGRARLPARSTLSRFLAALDQTPVEALRTVFLEDLLARPVEKEKKAGGLWDRQGTHYLVFDIDGTRQAARQRALPCTPDLPSAQRRLDEVCAPGYLGRKRGEVVRTRTTILQAHTHQWVGTFSGTSGAGNGDYRGELRQAVKAISAYVKAQSVQLRQAVARLDGQYGNGAIVADLAGLAYVMRGKDYDLLNRPEVQARLAQPPDQQTTHPEVVYELFYTALPGQAFTAADVVALYLHRGASAPVLSDEDQEQEPDRWCSHTAWGQEFWLILAQWIWNLRLELGHALHPTAMRTTEFAPAKARSGCAFRRASTRLDACTAGSVWICAMGTSFFYGRLSRFSFSPTSGWNATLPRRSSPLSTRTPTRTRWLAAGGVCRTDRSLSYMRAARAVSRIGNHPQSSAGQCGVSACLFQFIALRGVPTCSR